MNIKPILTGALSAIGVVAIVLVILFACGVFTHKDDVKLPITYPNENINWVMSDDGALRASFSNDLKITQDNITIVASINGMDSADGGTRYALTRLDNQDFAYTVYEMEQGFSSEVAEDEWVEYELVIRLYDNAELTEDGDITTGDGFVIEFGGFAVMDDSSEYVPTKIDTIKITNIYENGNNVQIVK